MAETLEPNLRNGLAHEDFVGKAIFEIQDPQNSLAHEPH